MKCTVDNIQHSIGNPVFALETNMAAVRKRVEEAKPSEAIHILNEMQTSLERIKKVLATIED